MLTKKPPSCTESQTKTGATRTTKPQQQGVFGEVPSNNDSTPCRTNTCVQTKKSRVIVKFDVGFHNFLTIRGNGGGLSWEQGTPLRNTDFDEWIWETNAPINTLEFKVLINDNLYETGNNHVLKEGKTVNYTPSF